MLRGGSRHATPSPLPSLGTCHLGGCLYSVVWGRGDAAGTAGAQVCTERQPKREPPLSMSGPGAQLCSRRLVEGRAQVPFILWIGLSVKDSSFPRKPCSWGGRSPLLPAHRGALWGPALRDLGRRKPPARRAPLLPLPRRQSCPQGPRLCAAIPAAALTHVAFPAWGSPPTCHPARRWGFSSWRRMLRLERPSTNFSTRTTVLRKLCAAPARECAPLLRVREVSMRRQGASCAPAHNRAGASRAPGARRHAPAS